MTEEQLKKAYEICEAYDLDPSKYEVRVTSSKNIALSENGHDIHVFKKDGTSLNGSVEKNFTNTRIKELHLEIEKIVGKIFDFEINVSSDKKVLVLKLNSKVSFLQKSTFSYQYAPKSKIVEGLRQKIGIIRIIGKEKEKINNELDKLRKQFGEIQKTPLITNNEKEYVNWFNTISKDKNEMYLSFAKRNITIIHNNFSFPYSTFFSSQNKIKKDFTKKIAEEIKKIRKKNSLNKKYNEVKKYCKDIPELIINTSNGEIKVSYKNHKLTLKLEDPYKNKIKKFVKKIDTEIENKTKEEIAKAEKEGLAGNIIAVAVCSILEGGASPTESCIIKLLRGLSISGEFWFYNRDKINNTTYLRKFNKISNEEIQKIIRKLISNNYINEVKKSGTFGSFYVCKSNNNTKTILQTTHLNEFAILNELDDKEEIHLPSLISHPACYYFSSTIQSKLKNIDEKTTKYLKTLYKIEDNQTKKKLIKTILDNKGKT